MFPAQTSLMPVYVALARFLEQGGDIWGNYPYWYLGTTPFRYLTGPVIPLALLSLHRILPWISLFDLMLGITGLAFLVGGLGIGRLVRELAEEENRVGRWAVFFYLTGSLVPLLFSFGDGARLIGLSCLPFILVWYARFLREKTAGNSLRLILSLVGALLINTGIIPSILISMAAILISRVGWKNTEQQIMATLKAWLAVLAIATLWYTPGYWLTLLKAPSFAGKPAWQVIFNLGKILPIGLAFGAAMVTAKFFRTKNTLRDTVFYWLFIFGSLTFFRFLADPDFWMDWTAYHLELQMGFAMGLGMVIRKCQKGEKYQKYQAISWLAIGIYIIAGLIVFRHQAIGNLRQNISDSVEERISRQLSEIAKENDLVFLSGSPVFWLNALADIRQVRGGSDQASVDPDWRGLAWEIREGMGSGSTAVAIKELGIEWLVVHTDRSQEPFHDFKNFDKFDQIESLELVSRESGDLIYRVVE